MNRKFILLSLIALLSFTGCNKSSGNKSETDSESSEDLSEVLETPDSYIDQLPSNAKDGAIFHAFCWKFNDIKNNLKTLAEQGFRSVQTSPIQSQRAMVLPGGLIINH